MARLAAAANNLNQCGNRTQMTWPDGVYVAYDYDAANELSHIYEYNGGGHPTLATYTYDDLGRNYRITVTSRNWNYGDSALN